MIDLYKIGKKIYAYRKEFNLTQDELALKLYVTRQALSKWENGISAPSVDSILLMCKLFDTQFENLLCLNDANNDIDEHNLFKDHTREYVVNLILDQKISIDIPSVFYQFSPNERMLILKAIKEKRIKCNLNSLRVRLTTPEQKYLFNKIYIGENNYDYKKSKR